MKKIILLVLVLMTLTACGGVDNSDETIKTQANKIRDLELRIEDLEREMYLVTSQDDTDRVSSILEMMCTNRNRIGGVRDLPYGIYRNSYNLPAGLKCRDLM